MYRVVLVFTKALLTQCDRIVSRSVHVNQTYLFERSSPKAPYQTPSACVLPCIFQVVDERLYLSSLFRVLWSNRKFVLDVMSCSIFLLTSLCLELQDICIGYEELLYLSSLFHVLWSNRTFVLDTDPGKRRIQTDCPLYNIFFISVSTCLIKIGKAIVKT